MRTLYLCSWILSGVLTQSLMAEQAIFSADFDSGNTEGWKTTGDVAVDTQAFEGSGSLVVRKPAGKLTETALAESPWFKLAGGNLEVRFALKTQLTSQDNSYNADFRIEYCDAEWKLLGRVNLAQPFRNTPWKSEARTLEPPAGAAWARLAGEINKETPGHFWIDHLVVKTGGNAEKRSPIRRITFTTAQLGNLLYPEDSRKVALEVWTGRILSADELTVHCRVKDYWGAEQSVPIEVKLAEAGRKEELYLYSGQLDLAAVPLSFGRYYEIHGAIGGAEAFSNHTSFAILPEAAANQYPPQEIPFTARSWDATVEAAQYLTKRMGIRLAGVWANWSRKPPYEAHSPTLDLVGKLGMGCIAGLQPIWAIEHRSKGYEKTTEEVLREGIRSFVEKYRHIRPMVISIGNEPHNTGDEVKKDIEAYRTVYTEFKKLDPSITVVGTSVGPEEEYFKAGLGEWCDVYDFHSYEDSQVLRDILQRKYPELFRKYGKAKPIWATETGLNSQGMSRQAVAAEVFRKSANFFAAGGANLCWFSLLYPDPDATIVEDTTTAHNVFDSRYSKFAPKLDAIALFNTVNSMTNKKFREEKVYPEDLHAFLFADAAGNCLQILYKQRGRADVIVPLPDAGGVEVIRLDGSRRTMDASPGGLTLTITEDPVLLLYQQTTPALAETLNRPGIWIESPVAQVVQGGTAELTVRAARSIAPDSVTLELPPFWQSVKRVVEAENGERQFYFQLTAPVETEARACDLTVRLTGGQEKVFGELYCRPEVQGMIAVEVLPVPADGGGIPAVKLVARNNGGTAQPVDWEVALQGEQRLKEGRFTLPGPTEAHFTQASSGRVQIEAGSTCEVILPIGKADLSRVYRVRAILRDPSGRVTIQERPVSGFYGVKRGQITPDGRMDESAWQTATVRRISERDAFYAFRQGGKPVPDWTGPEDLSCSIRFLWDEQFLYLGAEVSDDKLGNLQQNDMMWAQDGLQFLVDPTRTSDRKVGKYDYFLGDGRKGPQIWSGLSADAGAPTGEVRDMKLAVARNDSTGVTTYEVAIPWSRVAPFTPQPGGDLGFTLIVNEDDGHGRDAFLTWFGDAHTKDVDKVGDLILEP